MISQYNYSTSKQPKVHIYTGYIDVIHASLITFRIFFQSNNTCTHLTFLAIEVVVLAEENLMTMESIALPDINSPAIRNMSPMFQIPSAVLLNQMEREGIINIVLIKIIVHVHNGEILKI